MIDTLPVHHLTRVMSILNRDEVVAFPTGTTYGFGANALSPTALQRLTDLKGRNADKAYSLLLPAKKADEYVAFTSQEKAAFQTFADKPLTLLVKPQAALASLAKDGRVGIRTPDHPFVKELADLLTFPITATSANRSGEAPAYSVEELMKAFNNATFMAVDGGTLPKRKPSTVAYWNVDKWEIVREGDVRLKDLKTVI